MSKINHNRPYLRYIDNLRREPGRENRPSPKWFNPDHLPKFGLSAERSEIAWLVSQTIPRHAELVSASMVRQRRFDALEAALCLHSRQPKKRGTLYIGVTSDLAKRLWQHRTGETKGFVGRYRVFRLVLVEAADTMEAAIAREKQLKRWHRQWKINLIEAANPDWRDLAVEFGFAETLGDGC